MPPPSSSKYRNIEEVDIDGRVHTEFPAPQLKPEIGLQGRAVLEVSIECPIPRKEDKDV